MESQLSRSRSRGCGKAGNAPSAVSEARRAVFSITLPLTKQTVAERSFSQSYREKRSRRACPERSRRNPDTARTPQHSTPFSHKIPVSRPSNPKNRTNSHSFNHIPHKNSWHSSFPPSRIIKSVSKTKQTRPASRVFAFNTSRALSACLTCIV